MLLGGDERARTQHGNNNAYCQDNEISWFDWSLDERRRRLLDFSRRLIHFRLSHPVFRRTQFLTGGSPLGSGLPDSWWFRTDGRKMTRQNWADPGLRAIGLFLNGDEIPTRSRLGEQLTDESFLLLFNSHEERVTFLLPPRRFGQRWKLELSTADPEAEEGARSWPARSEVEVEARSIVLLRRGW
jgi:glycogen operon protein